MPTPGEISCVDSLMSNRKFPCWCRCCGQSPARCSVRPRCHTPQRAGLPSRCECRRPSRSLRRLHVSSRYSCFFSFYLSGFIESLQELFNANTNHFAKGRPPVTHNQVFIEKIHEAWRTIRKQLLFAEKPGLSRARLLDGSGINYAGRNSMRSRL